VARGAAFAFRKYSPTLAWARRAGIVFAAASLVTPFFLGTIAGAVASGRVPADGDTGLWSPWINVSTLLGGALAVTTCTFLAGVFLATEAETLGQRDLADALRRTSVVGGLVTGGVVVAGIPIVSIDDQTLTDGLLGRALPLVLASALAGSAALWLLHQRHLRAARSAAVVAVATVVAGWGFAQYPWILVDEVRIDDGAGARSTLIGLLVAAGVAAVLVVPPLIYLFRLADSNRVGSEGSRPHP
jgi:cytochrome d ubiquinol oxidase subunit II